MIRVVQLSLFAVLCLAVFGFGGMAWLAYGAAYDLVYPYRIRAEKTPLDMGIINYEDVRFTTVDGLEIAAWYVPSANGAVIILVHGLGSNRGELLEMAAALQETGFGALLVDLRNSGDSSGSVTTLGLLESRDVIAGVDFLVGRTEVDPERIGIYGMSMGAATTLMSAGQDERLKAVVSAAGFTSIEANIRDSVQQLTGLPPVPFAPMIVFFGEYLSGMDINLVRPIDALQDIAPRPVMFVHGDLDGLILVRNAYELYEAAGEPKVLHIIPGAGHGNYAAVAGESFHQVIVEFFTRWLLD